MIGYIILAAVAVVLAIVVVRAIAFVPRQETEVPMTEVTVDTDRAVESLAEMVRCKTISNIDLSRVDEKEFVKFRNYLQERYPAIHKTCTLEHFGSGLLYRWKGKGDGQPTVLMSHYDVVPAGEEAWEKPPFGGVIENGVLWGRGTLDTKGTLCGVMESAENLINSGFVPQNDIYFSFGGDEEVYGAAARSIVAELKKRGIKPALVVDEGGAVVENVFPGMKGRCALIGIGEKGMMNLKFTVKSKGGHASEPPVHGPIGKLSQAVLAVENHPFPSHLVPPVAGMFDALGRRSSFVFKLIFANLWLFMPVLQLICKSSRSLNASLRTTCAFTMMEASNAANVLPPEASVVANLRIIGGDTPKSAMEYLKKVINNSEVELTDLESTEPSPFSPTDSDGYAKVKTAVAQTWPGVTVSPYLMVACSDSRHFCEISDNVLRFSACELSSEERKTIHGHNERIPVKKVGEFVAFYLRLMQQL